MASHLTYDEAVGAWPKSYPQNDALYDGAKTSVRRTTIGGLMFAPVNSKY